MDVIGFVGPGDRPTASGPGRRAARRIATAGLGRWCPGSLRIMERGRTLAFGDGSGGLQATVAVNHQSAWSAVVGRGSIGLGESYAAGAWDVDDLTAFIRILLRRIDPLDRLQRRADQVVAPLRAFLQHARLAASRGRSRDRQFVRAHYDLGNEFFELFLDETMAYSCAVFDTPAMSLVEASRAKFDRLCRKLALGRDDHLVEIGTGWGGFAVHAAERYGCRVTTTTISDRQFEYATRRVHDAGLSDRVRVLHDDYRDLRGRFDKLVSIEMIEAVDWRDHDAFFATCSRILESDGLMALQAITIPDQRFEHRKTREDFIKRHIFPGGCLPSVAAIERSVADVTDLQLVDLEDIGQHYAVTLDHWRRRLHDEAARLPSLGFDAGFTRLWDFYLAFCEAGFRERHVSDVQLVLAKPGWRAPVGVRAG